jgi:hypothetical protein
MGVLRDRMEVDLRLRGLSPITQRMYLGCAQRFVAYHRRSPTALGESEIRAFRDHLVRERRVSRSTASLNPGLPPLRAPPARPRLERPARSAQQTAY